MYKQGKGGGIVFIVILLIVILIWGFVGGQQAQSVGITCDMGIGDSLCWKWHTNIVGQVTEGINDFFGG